MFSSLLDSVRSLYNDPNSSLSATLYNIKPQLRLIRVAT